MMSTRTINATAMMLVALAAGARAQAPQECQKTTQSQPPESPPAQGENPRQEANTTPQAPVVNERWNLFYQATSIGDYHGSFNSPYSGPLSLQDTPERDVSLTTTLFFGLRLDQNTQLYFDPEIAGGKGFSDTNGIADFPNGEMPRVTRAAPKPYLARLYITHDFGFGKETEAVDSDENQLGGRRPVKRYTIIAGRFSAADFFDNNRYTHDPRTQFMSWGTMYNGAWDYPADTRGYTWGWVHEFHTANWSVRYGSAAMPRVANGEQFDRRLFRDRSDMWEEERRWTMRKHPGAIRTLEYMNHADMGNYAEAIAIAKDTNTTPSVVATRKVGTLKYGFGINLEQEITKDIGVFTRLGWNDGKTESFAFTVIDRLASGGVSITGQRWHRSLDTAATALTVAGLSSVHAQYLADGGLDFLI
jgi:high affinity Mn2+ porin